MCVVGLLDRCYAHEIKSVADAMVEQGLDKLGYQYVNMDDCWSATSRDSNGQLQVTSPSSNTHTPSPLFHI
jgi:alpha-galactosidase